MSNEFETALHSPNSRAADCQVQETLDAQDFRQLNPVNRKDFIEHRLRVHARQCHGADLHILQLTADSDALPKFRPGQYVNVGFSDGLARPLSIASTPFDSHLEFHIRHLPGSEFTRRLIEDIDLGDSLLVGTAQGKSWLRDDGSRPILLVAGGTGLAPALAIIAHLCEQDDKRDLHLFWGVGTPDDLYAKRRLDELMRRNEPFRWQAAVMEPTNGWQGAIGLVHEVALASLKELHAHDIYISGPPVMLRAADQAFKAAGAQADRLFHDLE